MGTKPEVTKPKLWSNHEAEALTFWKHEAEAEVEAEAFSKAEQKNICVSGNFFRIFWVGR